MATEFSRMSQSERSRYRLEVSKRRLQKLSTLVTQYGTKPSVMAGLTIQHGSNTFKVGDDGVSLTAVSFPGSTFVSNMDAIHAELGITAEEDTPVPKATEAELSDRFTIEKQVGSSWIPALSSGHPSYADRARDLESIAQIHAKQELGTKFRIKRVSGDRAVIRIAARKSKNGGSVECYSWKS